MVKLIIFLKIILKFTVNIYSLRGPLLWYYFLVGFIPALSGDNVHVEVIQEIGKEIDSDVFL